jgi:UPF0716 protein FxsA
MGRIFAIGFLVLPLLEIAMFIIVGRAIGLLPTLLLVIAAAVLGAFLLRQQGLSVLSRMRGSMSAGTLPGRQVFDAMLLGMAAVLLVLPGFLTDIAALLLLVPPVRHWIFRSLSGRMTVVETTTSYRRHADPDDPRLGGPPVVDLDDKDWRS